MRCLEDGLNPEPDFLYWASSSPHRGDHLQSRHHDTCVGIKIKIKIEFEIEIEIEFETPVKASTVVNLPGQDFRSLSAHPPFSSGLS